MNKKLIFLLTSIALFGLARVYYHLTDDFRLANIHHDLPYTPAWEVIDTTAEKRKELESLLDQKFNYLGKGAQVYAFGSADGNYVIKFFKFKHIRPSFLYNLIPPIGNLKAYKEKKIARKEQKVNEIFNGYKVAYERDPKNTGVLFLHLNKTQDLHLKAHIVDKIGFNHELNLDDTIFVIQKRGITLRDRLKVQLDNHDIEGVKKSLFSILNMYFEEYQLGLFDHDHGVTQNTGFTDDAPFHLDVGKLFYGEEYKDPMFYQKDITWVALKMSDWLEVNAPEHAPELTKSLAQFLSKKFGHKINLKKAKVAFLKENGRI